MKIILILSIMASLLFADDMARIESIVKDVSALRQKYEACQDKLDQIESSPQQCAVNELELKARHQEILALQKENESLKQKHGSELLHVRTHLKQTIADYESKITLIEGNKKELNKEIVALKSRLDDRDQKIRDLLEANAALKKQSQVLATADKEQQALKKENNTLKRVHAAQLLELKTQLTQTITDNKRKIRDLDDQNTHLKEEIKALHVSLDQHEKQELILQNKTLSASNIQDDAEFKARSQVMADLKHENANLKKEIEKLQSAHMADTKRVLPCSTEATFPKLTMKPGFEHLQESQKSQWSTPKTYRLKHKAKIYDAMQGKVLETWEARRSFTSMNQQQDWIQITGYFVDRKWRSARNESLWVKEEDAFLRVKK